MKPDDRLIIDGEVFDPEKSMARRDNPHARKFVSALLASVGIESDDGDIGFNLKRDDRHTGLHLITRYFRAERDLSATVAGQEIPLERGERIGMNFQYAYTPEAFRWLVGQHGGLQILQEYSSPDARFLTVMCKK
jgi:hypothetical protein